MGNLSVIPEKRSWKLVFTGVENVNTATAPNGKDKAEDTKIKVTAGQEVLDVQTSYDKASSSLIVEIPMTDVNVEIAVTFTDGLEIAKNQMADRAYKLLEKAQIGYNKKADVLAVIEEQGRQRCGNTCYHGIE